MKNKQKSPISDIVCSLFEIFMLFGIAAGFIISGIFQLEIWQYILFAIGGFIWLIFSIVSIARSVKRLKYQRSFNINPNPQEQEND